MGKWPNVGVNELVTCKVGSRTKGIQKCLTAALEDWRGVVVVVWGPPLAEKLGSWCHLNEQSLKRLFIHAHLSILFVGKEFLTSVFRIQSQP